MNKLRLINVNNYLRNKSSLLIFLLLIMGNLIPLLSGLSGGFFENLLKVLHNSYFNMFLFLAAGLSVINMRSIFSKKYDFVIRNTNYKKIINDFMIEIILSTIIIYITSFILACAFSVLFCLENYDTFNYSNYNINVLCYLVFLIIKSLLLFCLVNVIIYLLSNVFKKNVTLLLVLIFSLGFLMLSSDKMILNIYDFPLFYHYYFLNTNYVTFILEILCTSLQLIILYVINYLTYKIVIRKKRDL